MTDIENDYTPDPREAREFKKTSTAMLKGFSGQINFQNSNESAAEAADALVGSPELLGLTKNLWVGTDMNPEATYWILAYHLKKAGVPTEKIDGITRTSIGSVSGGIVPRKKLPSEVEEGLGNAENNVNRLSTGQPEAQIDTRKPFSPVSPNRTGYTNQNQTGGSELNPTYSQINQSTNPLGRTSNPQAQNLRAAGGRNPDYSVGRGSQGETGGREQSYDERARLAYSSISQKPGDARSTYKFVKPGSTQAQPTDKPEMLLKSRFMEDPKVEADTTYLVKHMTGALFKASEEELRAGRGITEESIGQSMAEESEAREMEAQERGALHRAEEDELDESDERDARKFEEDADELVRKARMYELAGDWKSRDEYLYLSKLKRGQAMGKMRAISSRHGNQNLPTGL